MAKKKKKVMHRWVALRRNTWNSDPSYNRYNPQKGRNETMSRIYEEGEIVENLTKPNKHWRIYGNEESYLDGLVADLEKEGYEIDPEWTPKDIESKHSQMMTEKEIERVRTTHLIS
jgi:hypothetical protein